MVITQVSLGCRMQTTVYCNCTPKRPTVDAIASLPEIREKCQQTSRALVLSRAPERDSKHEQSPAFAAPV